MGESFTVWTLSARFPLGVKSSDSRIGVADASRNPGASLNAGDNPDGEREAAFSSVARRIPRRLRDRKSFDSAQHIGAGDALTAAYVWSMRRKPNAADALRWGVAAGTASAHLPGMRFASLAQAQDVYKHVELRRAE